jgi:hypothetical protein
MKSCKWERLYLSCHQFIHVWLTDHSDLYLQVQVCNVIFDSQWNVLIVTDTSLATHIVMYSSPLHPWPLIDVTSNDWEIHIISQLCSSHQCWPIAVTLPLCYLCSKAFFSLTFKELMFPHLLQHPLRLNYAHFTSKLECKSAPNKNELLMSWHLATDVLSIKRLCHININKLLETNVHSFTF